MAPPPQEDEMEREVDNVLSDIARDVDEGSGEMFHDSKFLSSIFNNCS